MVNYYPKDQPTNVPSGASDPDPVFWNDYDGRNCYAYAINYTQIKSFNPGALAPAKAINHDHFADLNSIQDNEFRALCEADGLTWIGPVLAGVGGGQYALALFRASKAAGPLGDYHWMRRDSLNHWTHKQRPTYPSTHDLSEGIGAPVVSPTTANMNTRACAYRFIAYYSAPTAGLRDRSVSGCCLIATASFEAMGIGEDCDELNPLRWFRDAVVLVDDAGRRQVEAYYAMAPAAVANIRARPDADQVFAELHRSHIMPAIEAVRAGAHTRAREIFTAALTEVLPRFL